ncbi:hypothetical protein ACFO9Q_18495 [Paenibacillus sp. GCM10023252]
MAPRPEPRGMGDEDTAAGCGMREVWRTWIRLRERNRMLMGKQV